LDSIRRVPPNLVEQAEAFLAGERRPVEPRPSATVVLLRPADGGPEIYLLRRHGGMAFAAGMYAFPGGAVDPRDSDGAVGWAGPSAAEWSDRLECAEERARALVCAAMRETFEESGVLLAGETASTVVSDATGPEWEADRAALVDRSLAFTDLLDRRGLVLRTDLIAYWAHWITPEFEPRRYDTRFFVAVMPEGQRTRDVSGEADKVAWMRPRAAIAGVDGGAMSMLPPTYLTVSEMAAYASPSEVLAAARDRVVELVMPSIEMVDGVAMFTGTGAGDG
jgi:8-oxo-dGTP pyrophosphatase MutT (NUDIX family)